MTVGCYAFVTKNWKDLDFPLDLWLEYHREIFDKIAVVKFGDFDLPFNASEIVDKTVKPPSSKTLKWGQYGKRQAMKLLDTDWKVCLDIDEFVHPIDTSKMDPEKVYPLRYIHFWGSLDWMIMFNGDPYYQFRIHTGNNEVFSDAANINGDLSTDILIPVYHTNACRSPEILNDKWKREIERENGSGIHLNDYRLQFMSERVYENYASMYPGSWLVNTERLRMPSVLRDNYDRFDYWHPSPKGVMA